MHSRRAAAYLLPDRIVVHSEGRTQAGFWIATEPFVPIPRPAEPESIGEAVLQCIAGSETEHPNPTDWKQVREPLLKAAGLRSYRRLQETAAHCSISGDGKSLQVVPSHNGGTRGDSKGYHGLQELARALPIDSTMTMLGEGLLRAFAACTSVYQE